MLGITKSAIEIIISLLLTGELEERLDRGDGVCTHETIILQQLQSGADARLCNVMSSQSFHGIIMYYKR